MKSNWLPVVLSILIVIVITDNIIAGKRENKKAKNEFAEFVAKEPADTLWTTPWNQFQIPSDSDSGRLIKYGRQLITNTSYYLGPKGNVAQITNGLNCQNCHLDAGTIPFGNNFGKVYATYPQFKARNNKMVSIYDRINGCLQRSLDGKPMDSSTREMKAMYAYFKWVGQDVPGGNKRGGTGIMKLKYLNRPANPLEGRKVFVANCQTCHGKKGEGVINTDGTAYTYPPLWGAHSYNDGAGMYRLGNFAGFVKENMPFNTTYKDPKLTDEEAWDVAAFVNSQPRPHKDQSMDWKDIAKKPIDYPFGPYKDNFTEKQHKYGPFQQIKNFKP